MPRLTGRAGRGRFGEGFPTKAQLGIAAPPSLRIRRGELNPPGEPANPA